MTISRLGGGVIVKLRDLCVRITKGSTPTSYGFAYTRNGIRFIKAENIDNSGVASTITDYIDEETNEFLKRSVLLENDLLFSIAGTIGRVGLIRAKDLPANTNQALAIIRLRPGALNYRYLMHFLNSASVQRYALTRSVGMGRANLSLAELGDIDVPVISPDGQMQIVAEIEKQISRLDKAVANLELVNANLKRYKIAVARAAVEGSVSSHEVVVNLRHRGWRQIKLGEIVESMKNGIYKPRNAYADDGIACLRMYNIEDGRIVWKDIKRMKLTRRESDEYGLMPGDLLVNRVNSRELVGKTAPIPDGLGKCVFESKNIRLRLRRDSADPKFVSLALNLLGPAHFNRNAQQVVGMASISQPQVSALEIPLPSLEEQQWIMAEVEKRIAVGESSQRAVTENLQRASRIRRSTIQQSYSVGFL
jgi:type I restriction enzyme S subunit